MGIPFDFDENEISEVYHYSLKSPSTRYKLSCSDKHIYIIDKSDDTLFRKLIEL